MNRNLVLSTSHGGSGGSTSCAAAPAAAPPPSHSHRPPFNLLPPTHRCLQPPSHSAAQSLQHRVTVACLRHSAPKQSKAFSLFFAAFVPQMTSSWSEQEVALWLQEQGFGEFEDAFVSNNIDGRAIVNLSKEDLEDLGVKAIGKRLALVAAIVECFGKCAANKVEAAPASNAGVSTWQMQPVQHQPVEADDGSHLAHERIKLFIGGLIDGVTKEMLQQELQQFVPIDEVIVLTNPATGASKGSGFAFVMGKKNAETLMYAIPSLELFACAWQMCRRMHTGVDLRFSARFFVYVHVLIEMPSHSCLFHICDA